MYYTRYADNCLGKEGEMHCHYGIMMRELLFKCNVQVKQLFKTLETITRLFLVKVSFIDNTIDSSHSFSLRLVSSGKI